MPIYIKDLPEIEKMRAAGKLARDTMALVESLIKPGITELALNNAAHDFIVSHRATPSFLNYRNFPMSICVSVNNAVIHGVPSKNILKDGDIVGIDIGVYLDGFHGDVARTFPVGRVSKEAERLIAVTRQSFFEGMHYAKEGNNLHEISGALEDYVVANGFTTLKEYYGHGVGRKLHEKPDIPCFRVKPKGVKLQKGMTLAVEPMVCAGKCDVYTAKDAFTVLTIDGSLGAHYENTILITDGEPEYLTL